MLTDAQIAALPEEWRAVAEYLASPTGQSHGLPLDSQELLLAALAEARAALRLLSDDLHTVNCRGKWGASELHEVGDDWGCDDCDPQTKPNCWADHALTIERERLAGEVPTATK